MKLSSTRVVREKFTFHQKRRHVVDRLVEVEFWLKVTTLANLLYFETNIGVEMISIPLSFNIVVNV